jgi:hypothetical protein
MRTYVNTSGESVASPKFDTSVAHPARRYNYWLGGKDHFQADRDSGDAIAEAYPTIRVSALANRAFLGRAVEEVARLGVRQFLDIGPGIPAPGSTHEVAQAIAPESNVVYVDNDPIVVAHVRALATSAGPGRTVCIESDIQEYAAILADPLLRDMLDLNRPVGLVLAAVLHFVSDGDDPHGIVAGLMDPLPSGSYLVLSHVTMDFAEPEAIALASNRQHGGFFPRPYSEVSRFAAGLEVVEPGVVSFSDWRPQDDAVLRPSPAEAGGYAFVARKP